MVRTRGRAAHSNVIAEEVVPADFEVGVDGNRRTTYTRRRKRTPSKISRHGSEAQCCSMPAILVDGRFWAFLLLDCLRKRLLSAGNLMFRNLFCGVSNSCLRCRWGRASPICSSEALARALGSSSRSFEVFPAVGSRRSRSVNLEPLSRGAVSSSEPLHRANPYPKRRKSIRSPISLTFAAIKGAILVAASRFGVSLR